MQSSEQMRQKKEAWRRRLQWESHIGGPSNSPRGVEADVGGGPDFDITTDSRAGRTVEFYSQKTKTQHPGRDPNRQRQKVKAAQELSRNKPGEVWYKHMSRAGSQLAGDRLWRHAQGTFIAPKLFSWSCWMRRFHLPRALHLVGGIDGEVMWT